MAANSKNVLTPYKILDAVSMDASFTSEPTMIQYLDNVSIQIMASTEDGEGVFTLEGSLDHVRVAPANYETDNGNWITIELATPMTVSSADASFLLDLNQLSFPWIRIKYTRTSGDGEVNAYISAKAV